MKTYCVVYLVDGIHYRYRCTAKNVTSARKQCRETMLCKNSDITEVYIED